MRRRRTRLFDFFRTSLSARLALFVVLVLSLGFLAPSHVQSSSPAATPRPPTAIVIGFMGGNVSHDDVIRNELIIADRLRASYPQGVYFEVFENRRLEQAHQKILQLLSASSGRPSSRAGKSSAQVILYGHSWGASAVVALADELQTDGVPVALTVQVDSVEKRGQNDALIPANVVRAINFYQPDGMLHGRAKIRAANSARTQILGNFRFSYKEIPSQCRVYPWYERIITRTHIAIECDPVLWQRIEGLIRDTLGQPSLEATSRRSTRPIRELSLFSRISPSASYGSGEGDAVTSSPSHRAITAHARQFPITLTAVRPISISASIPRIMKIGSVGR
jgi:hypothetical protein